MSELKLLIDKLYRTSHLEKEEYTAVITHYTELSEYLFSLSSRVREASYGKDVYLRGLIEFTSCCKNDCLYCGIRRSNKNAQRYRLSKEQIINCCENGYALAFRTFVLQGGEDMHYTDDIICDIIKSIKSLYPDCAVTLSIGEKSRESYQRYFDSGADRFLLRHETANEAHYARLHPENMSLSNRKNCLFTLKNIGFQTGAGFMVGSPYQTEENLAEDMLFLEQLKPEMVGIGPFIPHKETPFGAMQSGTAELTLFMLGLTRLALPTVLLPATTALGTIHPYGRELALKAGANVIMPNLSPSDKRSKYSLYDNKIYDGDESAQNLSSLKKRIESAGYHAVMSRGDHIDFTKEK